MANGILNQLNASLELTLQDSIDGLEEFTLMMAYASSGEQFEILPVEQNDTVKKNLHSKPLLLTLLNTQADMPMTQHCPQKKRA